MSRYLDTKTTWNKTCVLWRTARGLPVCLRRIGWSEIFYIQNSTLVGGFNLPLWKIGVRQLGWWHSQLNGKMIQMFQTTNQDSFEPQFPVKTQLPFWPMNTAPPASFWRILPQILQHPTVNSYIRYSPHVDPKNLRWIFDESSSVNWGWSTHKMPMRGLQLPRCSKTESRPGRSSCQRGVGSLPVV